MQSSKKWSRKAKMNCWSLVSTPVLDLLDDRDNYNSEEDEEYALILKHKCLMKNLPLKVILVTGQNHLVGMTSCL